MTGVDMGIFKWVGKVIGGEVGREVGRNEYDTKSFFGKIMTLQTREGYAQTKADQWSSNAGAVGKGVDIASGDVGDVVEFVVDELFDD